MNIKKHIPNAITCGNLFCGCLAIVSAFNGNLIASAYLVGIAAVLDFFDGFAARILKVSGELGKQLDSLADMVTFGVVPGVMMFQMIKTSLLFQLINNASGNGNFIPDTSAIAYDSIAISLLPFIAFFITVFSGLRLAKFNIDTRQTTSFIGVPTPANAILIGSFPLILNMKGFANSFNNNFVGLEYEQYGFGGNIDFNSIPFQVILNPYFLVGLTILMSYLLVAELPLFALKFKKFSWADNKLRFSFLIISVLLLALFQFIAIPFIIFLYIVLSVINNMYTKNKI
ncbi:MAG: CDP-alcohol phosphatidyltransferase family protein [Bacteroidetes bacterium]|nr:CDP-alcohol phosphatidyltransferase family protein [Bacteroidota bacterium]